MKKDYLNYSIGKRKTSLAIIKKKSLLKKKKKIENEKIILSSILTQRFSNTSFKLTKRFCSLGSLIDLKNIIINKRTFLVNYFQKKDLLIAFKCFEIFCNPFKNKTFKNKKSNLSSRIFFEIQNCILSEYFSKCTFDISLKGGGTTGQADALQLALSRLIVKICPELKCIFKKEKLLIRDSRIKERKKYGLKGARKAPQYSKR